MSILHNRYLLAVLLLTLLGWGSSVSARPVFVGNLEPSNLATVERIVPAREADLVVIDSGWLEGFRTGMTCLVGSQEGLTGEILLVAVRLNTAIGLITDRVDGLTINTGNLVTIKTITASR